ncbi:restriction endonuclease subunit S domain-containing protein [Tessaracoccus caeni]|uniref:hypothetical protein n=1 Tax=Tessaracoccus caeni TaxID=3031239 RepID=UPI0023DB6C31|nr:hypothetical protein [Tessaracoccus caeni]MDF1490236.1 hypothetical protein [Tessaracoccus caeni]
MTLWAEKKVSDLIDGLAAGVSVRSRDGDASRPAVLKTSAVANGRVDFRETKAIVAADVSRAKCAPVRDAIVISRMNTPALVGAVGYVETDEQGVFLPDRLWIARSKRAASTDMRWLNYALGFGDVATSVRELATGTSNSMKNIPKSRLLELSLLVPSSAEQRAISTALVDVDSLIASLERLIAKKREIKQGLMQELLTGRTRLSGFRGDWAKISAGDAGAFKGGSGFPIRYQGGSSGEFPLFKVSDMNLDGNEQYMRSSNNWISEPVRATLGATVLPAGAIIFAKVGAAVFLERKRLLIAPGCIDNNMAAFVADPKNLDSRFAYYSLVNYPLSSLVAVGALPSLNASQLRSIPRVPSKSCVGAPD